MKKARANVATMLPFWASSAPNVWVRTSGDWWLAKNNRTSAKTSIPRISVATPMLLRISHESHAERVDERGDDERADGDEREHRRKAGRVRRVEEDDVRDGPVERGMDAVDDERDDDRDGRDRQDLGPEVEPAGEPAERPMRQSLRPLVDRSGDRVVARQLGEAKRHDELAGDDDEPGPEHHRSAETETVAEVAERSRADADEAEGQGEVRHEPERGRFSSGLIPQRP